MLAAVAVAGLGLHALHLERQADPHAIYLGPATHGLRAYLDPDTGEYVPPAEDPAPSPPAAPLSAQASIAARLSGQPPLHEVRTNRAGGGFAIDLQEHFRPPRRGPLGGS